MGTVDGVSCTTSDFSLGCGRHISCTQILLSLPASYANGVFLLSAPETSLLSLEFPRLQHSESCMEEFVSLGATLNQEMEAEGQMLWPPVLDIHLHASQEVSVKVLMYTFFSFSSFPLSLALLPHCYFLRFQNKPPASRLQLQKDSTWGKQN